MEEKEGREKEGSARNELCFRTRLRREYCRGGQSVFSLSFPEFCIAQRVLWYADGAEPRAEVGKSSPYQLSKLFESYFIKTVLKITRFLVQIRARARFIFSKKMNFFFQPGHLDNAKVRETTFFKIGH